MYKRAEHLMYNYTKYLICIDLLRDEYEILLSGSDVKIQSYRVNYRSQHSDPVWAYTERKDLILSRINKLETKIIPMKILITDLTNPFALDKVKNAGLFDVLLYVFIGRNSIQDTSIRLQTSKRTIYRRKNILIDMVINNMNTS